MRPYYTRILKSLACVLERLPHEHVSLSVERVVVGVFNWGIENPSFHSAKRGASLLGPEVPTGYPPWQEQGNSDHAGVLNGSKRLVCVQGVYESRLLLDTISTHQSTSGPPNWQCCNINHNVIYCTVVPLCLRCSFQPECIFVITENQTYRY